MESCPGYIFKLKVKETQNHRVGCEKYIQTIFVGCIVK